MALDNPIFTALAEVATCLCAQIKEDDLPDVCFCGIVPGEAIVADYASECSEACGMAWVRLVQAYPSTSVGVPSAEARNCDSAIGIDVEVGVLRCAPMPDGQGNPPSAEEQLAAAALATADMLAAYKAIACCRDSRDFLVGIYTPVGPTADAVGGYWTVSIQVM